MKAGSPRSEHPATPAARFALRLFIAISPDANARDLLTQLAEDVARAAGGRPPRGENLHLTLAFLGDVPPDRVAQIDTIGGAAAAVTAPFALALDRLGYFRDKGVAWIAPGEVPKGLLCIEETLRRALLSAGIRTEQRDFRPHMTLARRCSRPLRDAPPVRIAWEVDALALIRSETLPEGPRYTKLASWRLGSGSV